MVWFPDPPTINTPPFRWPEPRPRIYPTGRMPVTNAPVYAPAMDGLWPLAAGQWQQSAHHDADDADASASGQRLR